MEITVKQAGTIFIAAIFIFSAIGFALNLSSFSSRKTSTSSNIIDQPIADKQREIFLTSDVTILTIFHSDDEDSQKMIEEIEKLKNEMGEKLLPEKIDIRKYQTFSAEYNIHVFPTILIRGKENINAPIRLEGPQDYDTLKEKICTTYEKTPDSCG